MNDDTQTIEDAFNAIPPEIQQYMYSDEFSAKLSQLFTDTAIDGDKQKHLKSIIFGFFAQMEDEESLNAAVLDATVSEADRKKISDWLDVNVYQKILALVTEGYTNEDDETTVEESLEEPIAPTPVTAPTPITSSASLDALSATLTKPSTSTTVRRDYSLDSTPSVAPTESAPRAIDPYHEPIDNI